MIHSEQTTRKGGMMMAVNRKDMSESDWEALLERAAEAVQRANPHIGEVSQEYSAEDYAELIQENREMEHLWDELDKQRYGRPQAYTAADAVNDDRGE